LIFEDFQSDWNFAKEKMRQRENAKGSTKELELLFCFQMKIISKNHSDHMI